MSGPLPIESTLEMEMYQYMRTREKEFVVQLRWEKQPDLNGFMRSVIVDWLHDVLVEYDMHSETFHLTVSLIDRLLMKCAVRLHEVSLVCAASLLIASKYEEIHPPDLKEIVNITDGHYTENQILRMEAKTLNYLHFDVSVPTVEWFVAHMLNMTKSSKKTECLAHYLGDLSLLLTSQNGIRPSVIASACLALSNCIIGSVAWSEEMEKKTGIPLSQLEKPMTCLLNAFNAASQSEQRSMFEKYSGADYEGVALLPSPSLLTPHFVLNDPAL